MPKRSTRANPVRTGKVQAEYTRALRGVAKQVGALINAFEPGSPEALPAITQLLKRYSETISGWAEATAWRMLTSVSRQDEKAWAAHSAEMGSILTNEIRNAPTGAALRSLQAEQVGLIKSIPLEAAQRVHEFTLRGLEDSTRSSEYVAEIQRSGQVAESRARLIARTEVARSASMLTEVRATSVGSEGYIWRTSNDSDVRESHRKMNGKFVRWDTMPTLSDGTTTHAGQIYNCRCYPEPVIPED